MSHPKADIYQMHLQNPHAQNPLIIPVLVLCNTSDEELFENIKANSSLPLDWVAMKPSHGGRAVLVGGGPSVADHLDDIRAMAADGGTVFAMNAASGFLRGHGIDVDYQVIADAKEETSTLVDIGAKNHLFASQVNPKTTAACRDVILWHLGIDEIEAQFPAERVQRGGYALVGGGAAVGNSATCLAYVLGFRDLHCFGYDSSHQGEQSHAYDQPMNQFIPSVEVEWAGQKYISSVAMKAQAEKFQITAQGLKQAGCAVTVHGTGLLPAMFNTPAGDLTERDKYRLMWQFDGYRDFSPGEVLVSKFVDLVSPDGLIVDYGCGTGKASVAMHSLGLDVFLVDFADNCRDDAAKGLPFLEWDLTIPLPVRSPYGFCTDVMEHIPGDKVSTVLGNILDASKIVFFQISTVQDVFGDVIGERLHCTIKPSGWWADQFRSLGAEILWQEPTENTACFLVTRTPSEGNENGL
jgi:hypothetical protein